MDGRRIIKVPDDFKKNGVSVQGDESAEVVWFSVDRYYDATDLMGPSAADVEAGKQPIRIIIQWETSSAKGVSMALTDKDNRPFIDKDGKLYFGWPISSEITEQAGNVKFNVEGLSPTISLTSFQYSGSLVYWSQATTLHFDISAFLGSNISAHLNGTFIKSSPNDNYILII